MGVIQVPGRLSGKTYSVKIKGDTPSETEQARILSYVDEQESAFTQDFSQRFGFAAPTPEDGTAIGRGFELGKAGAYSRLGTATEYLGSGLGLESVADFGRGMRESGDQETFLETLRQPKPTTLQDVKGLGSFLTYAGEGIGQSGPEMLAPLAVSGIGTLVGGPVAGLGAGAATAFPSFFGGNIQRQEEEVAAGRKDKVDVTDAVIGAIGQSALNSIGDKLLLGGFLKPGQKWLTRTAVGAGEGAVAEIPTEITQQIIERKQAGLSLDDDAAINEYVNAGILGGIMGGGIRGTTAGLGIGVEKEATPDAPPPATPTVTPIDPATMAEAEAAAREFDGGDTDVGPPAKPATFTRSKTTIQSGGKITKTRLGLSDGSTLEFAGDPTAAERDAALAQYNSTRAPAAKATPATPATPPATPPVQATPTFEITKLRQQSTKSKTGPKYKTTATVAGVGPVEVFSSKKFASKKDPRLQAAVENQLKPKDVTNIGMDDVPRPPIDAYRVPPTTVDDRAKPKKVTNIGMGDVPFMPRGVDQAAAQGELFTAPAAPAPAAPAPEIESEADALERAAIEANERKIAEASAEADRRAAEAQAAPQVEPQAPAAPKGVDVGGVDEAISQGVGNISVTENGKTVPFDKFALSVDGNKAEVGFVERAKDARKGIGYDAYLALGEKLAQRGVQLQSSQTKLGPGQNLWKKLEQDGYAKLNPQTKRLEFVPQTERVRVAPEPQDITQEATNVTEGAEAKPPETGVGVEGNTQGVGEGTGVGSDGQTAEIAAASGAGGLGTYQSDTDTARGSGGAQSDTLTDVIPDVVPDARPKRKKRTTPKNALEARLEALRDYFAPGNIVQSYLGSDRVLSFDVDADGNWTVTVEAVKKEDGQWVPKSKDGGVRTHRTIDNKRLSSGPIERAKSAEEVAADATEKNAEAIGVPRATVGAASALDAPLSANTRAFLDAGDLANGLLSLSKDTKNPVLKALAKKFSQLVGTTRVKVLYPGDSAKNIGGYPGIYWKSPDTLNPERENIIYLNGQTGMTAHVLMHEMAHAVTANVMFLSPNLPAMRQLKALYESVKKQVAVPRGMVYTEELYGLTNLREFVAEAYGRIAFGPQDNGLRDLMNNTLFTSIKYETNELPLTNFERFKEIIGNFFRGLVGMPSKPYPRRKITDEVSVTKTGLDQFHRIMDGLLSPAPQILPGKIFDAAVSEPLIGRNVLNNAGRVPTWSPSSASRMYDVIRENIPDWLRNFAISLQQIDWIADFSRKALPVVDDLKNILDRRQGESARLQKMVSQLPKRLAVLAKEAPEQFSRYTNILNTATRNQVDIAKARSVYKDDAGKLFIWDKLAKDMKAIDPDGRFREAYNIHIALNDSIRQEWLDAVTLQVNQTTEDPAERTALRDRLMAQLLESGIIDPYFPLMREGKYWVSYVQTETTSRPPTALGTDTKEALFAPEAVVSTFESIGAARAFIAQLNTAKLPDGRPAAVEITQEPFLMDFAKGYDKSVPLEFVQGAIRILDEIVPQASQREAGRAAIIEMFTRMSPAYSAMSQLRSRKDGGRAGAMGYESPVGNITEPGEYIAALQNRLAGTVNAIVNSKFVPELEAAKSRLKAQAENAQKDPTNTLADKIAINATANELGKRISFARNPTSSRVAYHGRGLTFLWTLGALPAATINVFFQMPMVVVPQLLGRHGSIGNITRAFNTARLISQSSGISQLVQEPGQVDPTQVKELENWGSLENYYSVDAAGDFALRTDRKIPAALRTKLEELAPLARYMSMNGMLGTTIAQSELSGMGDVASRIYRFSGLPLQYAERFTRQSTSIAAFLLEQDKIRGAKGQKDYKLTPEEVSAAVKYAIDTTELTNGTVGILTGPSLAQSGLGSILLMYKRYALSMLRFMSNGVQRSLTKITPDMTPEQVADAKMERKIARYQLASMLGATAIFAGIQGLPFFGEATTILDMMFTDDDEEDFKTLAQKSLQEPLYSGLVNYLTGAEVASRISMSGLVFRESPIQKDQSLLYDAFEMFGGPVLGTYLNVERGIGLVNEGEVYRGIEAMVPASVRAFMRAYRYAEAGGAETMRGDKITPLDSWDVAVQLLGYTPEAVIRTQQAVGREKRITEAIRSEKNNLYKRFNLAVVDGDYEEIRQIQLEMAKFMREHPELGDFDLAASIKGFRQRSQDMIGGVYIPKPFQARTRESLGEYDQEALQ